jgi:hypothetical protein
MKHPQCRNVTVCDRIVVFGFSLSEKKFSFFVHLGSNGAPRASRRSSGAIFLHYPRLEAESPLAMQSREALPFVFQITSLKKHHAEILAFGAKTRRRDFRPCRFRAPGT